MDKVIKIIVFFNFFLSLSLLFFVLSDYRVGFSQGRSMCPDNGQFSFTLTKIVKSTDQIEKGDVYIYSSFFEGEKERVHHRLMFIKDDKAYFKGDGNAVADYPVALGQIIEKEVYNLPIMGC